MQQLISKLNIVKVDALTFAVICKWLEISLLDRGLLLGDGILIYSWIYLTSQFPPNASVLSNVK